MKLEDDFIITVSDARACFGGCVNGWIYFCNQHGLSIKETLRDGVSASKLLETGNDLAIQLVEYVNVNRKS